MGQGTADPSPIFDFTTFPILTTDRLRLRPITHADADQMIAIFGAPEVLRFLNDPPIDTRVEAIELIDWLNDQYENRKGVNWGITLRGDDGLIGHCGIYAWNREDRHVDIGFHLVPARWGQGYATEAARAVVGWCFDHLGVHRVQADCTDGNLASEKVLLKCGFTVEGLWRESCWEHGRFVDIRQFGLLRREWEGGA